LLHRLPHTVLQALVDAGATAPLAGLLAVACTGGVLLTSSPAHQLTSSPAHQLGAQVWRSISPSVAGRSSRLPGQIRAMKAAAGQVR